MELKGKVVRVLPIEGGTSKAGKEWHKASVIVETPGQYPKLVKVSHMKEAQKFAQIPVGFDVTLHIDIESREFNGRWYTEINCYKWEVNSPTSPISAPVPPKAQSVLEELGVQGYQRVDSRYDSPQEDDGLPF